MPNKGLKAIAPALAPILSIALALTLPGCGAQGPQPLTPRTFVGQQPEGAVSEAPLSATDSPGQVPEHDTQSSPSPPPLAGGPSEGISDLVRDVVQPAGENLPTTVPSIATTTAPATTEPQVATSVYLELGSVLAIVNARPIYANTIIRKDAVLLGQLAREYHGSRFEIAARDLIVKSRDEQIHYEVEVAAAEKTLDNQDKQLAEKLTTLWRERQKNEAGGSLQVAERRAAARGKSFEEEAEDQHRSYLVELYVTRKEEPRVQITGADLYRYYQQHLQDPELKFSTADSAVIQIICIDPKAKGSLDLAISDINDIHDQASRGADFTALTRQSDMGPKQLPVEKGSFTLKRVEQAVWKLRPGQISDVIKEDDGKFYIIKVISMVPGVVQPFDDETVQDKITNILRRQQLQAIRMEEQIKLSRDAIITATPEMVDKCVDLAMQNYSKWAAGK